MKRLLLAGLLTVGIGMLSASPSLAVHKNYQNMLTCGNCHTMHNSQGSTTTDNGNGSLGGSPGGSLILLRGVVSSRAEIHNFCLQCHGSNGAQASNTFGDDNHPAPKVYINAQGGAGNSAVAGTLDDFSVIGAGGDFSAELSGDSSGWSLTASGSTMAQGKGHSLGATNVTPPGGDAAISAFSCTNCHDPHGAYTTSTAISNKFRNLRVNATGAELRSGVTLNNDIKSYVGDPTATTPIFQVNGTGNDVASTNIWPLYDDDANLVGTLAGDSGRSNTYPVTAGAGLGTDGVSRWCAQCHDQWHEAIQTNNNASPDWKRHPVDNPLTDATPNSGAGVLIIDTTNYPFPDGSATGFKALPVAATTAAGNGVAYLVSGNAANSKVFCLSCHFAHGGPYYDNLRWNYTSSVGQGSQAGNSIASNVGCQLCHNR